MLTAPLRILMTRAPTAASRPWIENHLYLAVAFETDDHFMLVTPSDLTALGLTADQAWEQAWNTLERTTAPSDLRPTDTDPDVWYLVSGDGLASSRLPLLPKLVESMPLGGLMVAVAAHHQLLIVPIDSVSALDALHVLASTLSSAIDSDEAPLSDQLFWYDGTRWIPVPVEHGDDIVVLPPDGFAETMSRVAAMDLVSVAGEA